MGDCYSGGLFDDYTSSNRCRCKCQSSSTREYSKDEISNFKRRDRLAAIRDTNKHRKFWNPIRHFFRLKQMKIIDEKIVVDYIKIPGRPRWIYS